jgi:hypothetical protein
MNLLCNRGWHLFKRAYRHGDLKVCRHCGHEKRLTWATVADPELAGRQLAKPKTRGRA